MIDRVERALDGVRDSLSTIRTAVGGDSDSDPDSDPGPASAGRPNAADRADGSRLVSDGGWEAAESPTSRTLHDVVHAADGPYACGEGGALLDRADGKWRVLLERGPGVAKNTLRSIDATDDGCRVWFAGDSGALGSYDVADGRLSDYSAPMEKTSTWEAIAVSGETGEERLRVANGSGEVLDVVCEDGCPVWGEVVEPGGGSTIPALTAGSGGFYAVDTSGGAYLECGPVPDDGDGDDDDCDDGEGPGEWERIGIRNAQVDFHDVRAGDRSVFVAGSDGIAYRYDPNCENWTPLYVGEGALQAIRVAGDETVAVATGGRVYERLESVRWESLETPTEQSLFGLALARSGDDVDGGLATAPVDVAVGAGGTVLERTGSE